MRRLSPVVAVPLAATALVMTSLLVNPAQDAGAQTPKPAATPAAKPAGAATAPRAGGIPLEFAGAMVAGGSAVAGVGLFALRRRRR
jgi:hypothetical protein